MMYLVCIFIFCFYFLFLFFEKCFHFQKIRILKHVGLTSCFLFSRNKNTENAFSKENIFLDLLKITFIVNAFSFYPKWDSWFQLKTRFNCFQFLVRFRKYFHWKWKEKSNQTHFHHHFLFPVKMKIENNQTKHLLSQPLSSR